MFMSPSFSSPGFLAWNFPANVWVCNAYRTICGGSLSDDVWEVGSGCLGPPRGDAWLLSEEQGGIWSDFPRFRISTVPAL